MTTQQQNPPKTYTVIIVDDQKEMRIGLSMILNKSPQINVIATASHGEELLSLLEQLVYSSKKLPDLVIMDVRMPIMDGIETTRQLSLLYPSIKVLVLTTYDQNDYAFGALDAGASGFLLKDARASELRSAACAIANGDAVLTPRITRELLSQSPRFNIKNHDEERELVILFSILTQREKEICALVADGYTNSEIAEQIIMQPASVKRAITRILAKLNMKNRVQLAIAWHKSTSPTSI